MREDDPHLKRREARPLAGPPEMPARSSGGWSTQPSVLPPEASDTVAIMRGDIRNHFLLAYTETSELNEARDVPLTDLEEFAVGTGRFQVDGDTFPAALPNSSECQRECRSRSGRRGHPHVPEYTSSQIALSENFSARSPDRNTVTVIGPAKRRYAPSTRASFASRRFTRGNPSPVGPGRGRARG